MFIKIKVERYRPSTVPRSSITVKSDSIKNIAIPTSQGGGNNHFIRFSAAR